MHQQFRCTRYTGPEGNGTSNTIDVKFTKRTTGAKAPVTPVGDSAAFGIVGFKNNGIVGLGTNRAVCR